ncbi:unnamed protein product [Nesidiocoris tenuis]|uniref:Uncharacterized protein n=1 Tax=Nesidiocoris tenuis TaxID=355587 RepID=A0A6H5HPZ8_9HEMI|nr:unnamed protein product [Nesidiocoris tenuis]
MRFVRQYSYHRFVLTHRMFDFQTPTLYFPFLSCHRIIINHSFLLKSLVVRRIASRFSYIENHQPTTSKPAVSVTFHELMDVTVHHNGSVVPVCQDSRPGQQSCLHVYRHQKRDARPGARCDQQRIFLRQSKMGDHFLADRQSSWRLFGLEINVGPDAGLRRLLVHHPQSGTFFSERRILWKAGEDY